MKTSKNILFLASTLIIFVAGSSYGAGVFREGGRVEIEDRNGDRWDVSQAEKIGFAPRRFRHGIGKDAFTPLNDGDFTDDRPASSSNTRIIGVVFDGDAHAYSVNRLKRHEIANTTIADQPIAAGY